MTLSEILFSRRSQRKFTSEVPPRVVIDTLLKEALTAPSSKSTRSTRYIVVSRAELLDKMAQMRDRGSMFLKDAPVGIIVLGDTEASDLWDINATISTTILQLAAEERGLGSCWVQVKDRPRISDDPSAGTAEEWLRSLIEIPTTWRPLCVVALGYPEAPIKPHTPQDDSDKVIYVE